MRVLFLPNFRVQTAPHQDLSVRDANKRVEGEGYWFFRYWKSSEVDVLDIGGSLVTAMLESRLRIYAVQALRAIVKNGQYDLVISHSYNSGLVYATLRAGLGIHAPKHLVIDVGCLNGGRSIPWEISLMRYSLKSVAGIAYHSHSHDPFYDQHFPFLHRRFVPLGVNVEFFQPMAPPPSGEYCLSIGYAKRDYKTLVDAWRSIPFPLIIVGMDRLPFKTPSNVKLLPFVDINTLKVLIHNARIVVLPIANELYSVGQTTLLQCFSMGKPVVASDVPSIRDYARNRVNSWLVEYGNSASLREGVSAVLDDAALARDIGRAALQMTREGFTEETMAGNLLEFSLELVNS